MKNSSGLSLKLNERQVYNSFVREVLKGVWCRLNVYERYLALILVLLVDDYGCMEYDPRIVRNAVFGEMNISLSRINGFIAKLSKYGMVAMHITNCGRKILYAKYLMGLLPKTTFRKPELPLPPEVDWMAVSNDRYAVIHTS